MNEEAKLLQRIEHFKNVRKTLLSKLDDDFIKVTFLEGDSQRILKMLKGAKDNLKDTIESLQAYNDSVIEMEKKLEHIRRRGRGRTYRLDPILGVVEVEEEIETRQTSSEKRREYKFFTSCLPDEIESEDQEEAESEREKITTSKNEADQYTSSTVPPNSPVYSKTVLDEEKTIDQGKPKISKARKLGYSSERSSVIADLGARGDHKPLQRGMITTMAEVHQEDIREDEHLEEIPKIKYVDEKGKIQAEVLKFDSPSTYNVEKEKSNDEDDVDESVEEETSHVPMSPRSTLYTPQELPPLTLNGENITTEEIFGRPVVKKREHHKRKITQKIPPLDLKNSDEGSDARADNPETLSSEEEMTSEISFSGDSFASDVLSELTSREEWPNLVTPSAVASDFSTPKQSSWLRSGAMDMRDKYSPYLKTSAALRPKQWFSKLVHKVFPKKTPTVVPTKIEVENLPSSANRFKVPNEKREKHAKRIDSTKTTKTSGQIYTPRYPTFISSEVLTSQKTNREQESSQFYIQTPSTTTGATPKRYPTFITTKLFKKSPPEQRKDFDDPNNGSVLWIKKPERGVWFQDSDSPIPESPQPPPRGQHKHLQKRALKKGKDSEHNAAVELDDEECFRETFV